MTNFLAPLPFEQIEGLGTGYQSKGLTEAPTTMETIISNTVGFITVVAGLSFLVYIVIAGLTWITARDEAERISRAKQMFTNALVGLAIVVSAWAFAGIMQTVFGFDILSPASIIKNLGPEKSGGGSGGKPESPTKSIPAPVKE